MAGITVDIDTLIAKREEIEKLDETLDAQAGSVAAGRQKIANELIKETEETWTPVATQVVTHLKTLDEKVLVGVVSALTKELRSNFGTVLDTYLDKEFEARKDQQTERLSPEALEEVMEVRRTRVKEFQVLKSLLEMSGGFDEELSKVEDPKVRRGSVGPKGPRALSTFNYAIDGEALSDDNNSMSAIAKMEGKSSKELKEHLESNLILAEGQEKFELKKGSIPDEWSATLPSGKTLTATRMEQYVGIETEDDDSDDDGTPDDATE